nr:hypothetical protein [Tanacetum cinerariifolium]
KSQDTLEGNDQDKLLMASSNNKSNGKWRGKYLNRESDGKWGGKDLNRESNKGMKWKNDSNACRTNTNQGIMDKSKITCYECGEPGHFGKKCTKWKYNNKQEESHLIYDDDTEPTLL